MFKINVGRLNLKLMSYALERDASIFFSRSVDDFHSHRFISPPACFYIPTNQPQQGLDKKAIVIEFKENFNGKIWSTKSY